MNRLWAFLRLARLHFLAGGFLLYGLGAAIARSEGFSIDGALYFVGQTFATAIQLMTHFLNEYWDVEADRVNPNRTLFSGGSGVLAAGALTRPTAWRAAMVCLTVALAAGLALALGFGAGPAVWIVMLLAVGGSWFYSSPPLHLAASGFGELTTSLIVAFLLPAFAHLLQTGGLTPLVAWGTAPLVALHFAMLLAFEVPDVAADEQTGKRTLLVRLGRTYGVAAHHVALALAFGLLAIGMPRLPGAPTMGLLTFPLALAQVWQLQRLGRGPRASFGRLTFNAVSSFAVTAALVTFGFWKLG